MIKKRRVAFLFFLVLSVTLIDLSCTQNLNNKPWGRRWYDISKTGKAKYIKLIEKEIPTATVFGFKALRFANKGGGIVQVDLPVSELRLPLSMNQVHVLQLQAESEEKAYVFFINDTTFRILASLKFSTVRQFGSADFGMSLINSSNQGVCEIDIKKSVFDLDLQQYGDLKQDRKLQIKIFNEAKMLVADEENYVADDVRKGRLKSKEKEEISAWFINHLGLPK